MRAVIGFIAVLLLWLGISIPILLAMLFMALGKGCHKVANAFIRGLEKVGRWVK